MEAAAIFISHASADDAFVKELRTALESQGLPVWVDSRNLRGGAKLAPEITEAIETARQVLVVLSTKTINSPWVRKEIRKALAVERRRASDGYRVIPLLLPGVEPSALALWFDEEPVGVRSGLEVGEVSAALPQILDALGERLPDDYQPVQPVAPQLVEDLILELRDPEIATDAGERRVTATATLVYQPADPAARRVESQRFTLRAPLGPIEADELRWYLEQYYLWPIGVFKERAARVEAQLPEWGQALYDALLTAKTAQEALQAWRHAAAGAERRFSVLIDEALLEGATTEQQAAAREAASGLLTLPWELLHDGHSYLFQGAPAARVRRHLPNRREMAVRPTGLPIRVLLVSPRPEDQRTGYLDHRSSALPLVEAVEQLGELIELRILTPPTFPALQDALARANKAGTPFDVIHFDGHGVYDRAHGLGALCFEDAKDAAKLTGRAMQPIDAAKLAELISGYRVPLVFLDACQSARVDDDPTASVAAKLLEAGVTSVVAMSHSVLVETARRFVAAFYGELARGARVGTAMLAGQLALYGDDYRGTIMGAGALRLHDWFVPVLYQEQHDPQLITRLLPDVVQHLQARQRELSYGALPPSPPHHFQGRSRELLALERLLHDQRYAVVRGQGGEGKTTLAVELARWLVRTRRFKRVAFVSLEHLSDTRAVLDSLGRQLLPEGYSVAEHKDMKAALQPVERALRDAATLIVLDNMESALPARPPSATQAPDKARGVLVDPRRTRRARRQESHIRVLRALRGSQKPDSAAAAPIGERARRQESHIRVLRVLRGSSSGLRVLRGFGTPAPVSLAAAPIEELFALCTQLLAADPATRLLFTTREALPAPFDNRSCMIGLGALSRADAIALVGQVMAQEGLTPQADDPGGTPQEIAELVEAVDRHARALVLLAPEVARRGVRATTANLHHLMAELQRKHPGDRENSLYASVELSLRRLPPDMRERVRGLGVFYGGGYLGVIAQVLELDVDAARELAIALIEVGLAADMGYGHLRLDPALPAYLLGELSEEEQKQARARWANGMAQLVNFLYEQQFKDAKLAAQLTLLELPNLLALLDWIADNAPPEQVVELASSVEQLLAPLGRPQALAQATRVRELAARVLCEWRRALYLTESANIDRLLERGDLQAAHIAAQQLLQRCMAAGEAAYEGAVYDIAMTYFRFGRVLYQTGAADAALQPLAEARQRFQALADGGNTDAEYMASAALTQSADCLTTLGRLGEAAAAYEEAIGLDEKRGSTRNVAVGKFQLGTVHMYQGRYDEALKTYVEVHELFAVLGEPRMVAAAWHQIGIVHLEAGQYEQAEYAYQQSLAINVQQKDFAGEADSLGELGILYIAMGRLEEAATFYRQAADLYARLQNLMREGWAYGGLANALIKLRRYDEARSELLRALECKQPFGHAAMPWTTWNILYRLEQATGDTQAASQARAQAIAAYLAYRRAGGENHNPGARLCAMVAQAIQQGNTSEAEPILAQLLGADVPASFTVMLSKLQAILHGARDPALAADPDLHYTDAVELLLLLEGLGDG